MFIVKMVLLLLKIDESDDIRVVIMIVIIILINLVGNILRINLNNNKRIRER